jgi:hypothetical protein
MTGALLLQIVQTYATETVALGSTILTVDALNMVLISVLVFLFARQVVPIAAGLAGGVPLNSFSTVSRFVTSSVRGGRKAWDFGKRFGASFKEDI